MSSNKFYAWARKNHYTNDPSKTWVHSIKALNNIRINPLTKNAYLEFTFNEKHLVSVTLTEKQAKNIYEKIFATNHNGKKPFYCENFDYLDDMPW